MSVQLIRTLLLAGLAIALGLYVMKPVPAEDGARCVQVGGEMIVTHQSIDLTGAQPSPPRPVLICVYPDSPKNNHAFDEK